MSWESATAVLFDHEPSAEQISAFESFVEEHVNELEKCWDIKSKQTRVTFAKFITQLYKLNSKSLVKPQNSFKKVIQRSASLINTKTVFGSLITHALDECDELLLETVYSLLFTKIHFNSEFTSLWFTHRLKARENRKVKPSPLASALECLTSVEFINLRQDWMDTKPKVDLLKVLNTKVHESQDQYLSLSWGLALFILANQLHRIDTVSEEIVDIESLLLDSAKLSASHWSSLLLDLISGSVPGLATLLEAHEVVNDSKLLIASKVRLAQTVADVINHLAPIVEPSMDILKAIAFTIRDFEGLKDEQWLPENIYTSAFVGMPYTFSEVVYLSQTLNQSQRVKLLEKMHEYISEVNVQDLTLPNNATELDSSLIGLEVCSNKVVTVLQPRPTDLQGAIELEPNTKGVLVSFDNGICLVSWRFEYNGWSLIGRILENNALSEGLNWSSDTLETLRLIIMVSEDINVLNHISSGLSRGDVVDFVAYWLQQWLQFGRDLPSPPENEYVENINLAVDFLVKYVNHDSNRVWVLMSMLNWYDCSKVVVEGSMRILEVLLLLHQKNGGEQNADNKFNELQREAIDKYALLFYSQYTIMEPLNESVLEVISLLLPYSEILQQSFLSSSELRDTSISTLLDNLDSPKVLEFCSQCLGMISLDPKYTPKESDASFANSNKKAVSKFVNRKQTHLERKLFEKTKTLVSLFLEKPDLRQLVLNIWTVLIENPESPSLLAFLNEGEVLKLQNEFITVLTNKLEAVETIGDLSAFLAASRQQEGLLDMLRSSVMTHIEERAQITLRDGNTADMNTLRAIFDALKLSKKKLQPTTFEKLESVVSQDIDYSHISDHVALKISAIELLAIQMEIDSSSLDSLDQQIGTITSKIGVIYKLDNDMAVEIPNKGHSVEQLSRLLSVWCDFLIIAANRSTASKARKSDWGRRLLAANDFSRSSEYLTSETVQNGELMRFETVLYILSRNGTATFDLVKLLRDKITEAIAAGTLGLKCSRQIMLTLMKSMARVLDRIYSFTEKIDDMPESEICELIEDVFNITIIKELQVEINEQLLKPQLMIFNMAILLLGRYGQNGESEASELQQSLQRAIVESGCDRALITAFSSVPTKDPQFGELLLKFIHKILPLSAYAASSFVKNGLTNVIIDAPLCRMIQEGSVTQFRNPQLHSFWRNGVLPTFNLLLDQLGVRIAPQIWMLLDVFSPQTHTCFDQWKSGYISLELIEETMLLFAVMCHADQYAKCPDNTAHSVFDKTEMLKAVRFLLTHERYLSERLLRDQPLDNTTSALEDLEAMLEVN